MIVFGTEDVQQNIYVIFWGNHCKIVVNACSKQRNIAVLKAPLPQTITPFGWAESPIAFRRSSLTPLSIVDGAFLYRVTRRRRLLLTTNTLLKDMAVAARIGLR